MKYCLKNSFGEIYTYMRNNKKVFGIHETADLPTRKPSNGLDLPPKSVQCTYTSFSGWYRENEIS